MTPELLTEEELFIIRERETHLGAYPQVVAKLLRAYEALVQQVAELTGEAKSAKAVFLDLVETNNANQRSYWAELDKLRAALATEKAAREAAETERDLELLGKQNLLAGVSADLDNAERQRAYWEKCAAQRESETMALRAKLARVEVLIADSLEERHGPGGCGIYAYSLREALRD